MKKENVTLLSPEELFSAISQLLQEKFDAQFTVTGNSMWPFLAHGRDQVTLRRIGDAPLKKGEIVLLHTEQRYRLHRITRMKNGMVQTTGDSNCYHDAFVSSETILGRVVWFTRKGKTVSCTNPVYRFYSWLWRVLFPVRPVLLWLFIQLRRSRS